MTCSQDPACAVFRRKREHDGIGAALLHLGAPLAGITPQPRPRRQGLRRPASSPRSTIRLQMRFVLEALGVDLVDVFSAGWPGREPAVFGDDLQAADRRVVAGSSSSLARICSPASSVGFTVSRRQLFSRFFCSGVARRIDPRIITACRTCSSVRIVLAGILAGPGRDLGRQQTRSRPSLSVVQTVPPAAGNWPRVSSPPKQNEPSNSPGANHLKPTGTSRSLRPSWPRRDRSGCWRRASCRPRRRSATSAGASADTDRHRQIVIRVQQPDRGRHDPVPVRVWVVAEGDVDLSFKPTSLPSHTGWNNPCGFFRRGPPS